MNCFYDRGRRDHVVEFYSGFLHHLVLNNHSAGGFGGWGVCVILKPCPSPLNSCRQMLSCEWPCHPRGDPKLSLKAQTKPRQNSATTSCCERLLLVFSAQILLPCLITHRGFTFSKLLGKKFTVLLCLHPWRGANRKKICSSDTCDLSVYVCVWGPIPLQLSWHMIHCELKTSLTGSHFQDSWYS